MPKQKLTLLVSEETATAIKQAVADGRAGSQSAFVERAVEAFEQAVERDRIRRDLEEAANDPMFLEDLRAVMRDFAAADEELLLDG